MGEEHAALTDMVPIVFAMLLAAVPSRIMAQQATEAPATFFQR
jgi:hypothetical protein